MLKYVRTELVFKEIPGKVALAVWISNCKGTCAGCHSPQLREDIGIELTWPSLNNELIKKHGLFDIVLLMGGDSDPQLIEWLAKNAKMFGYDVGWYSGSDFYMKEIAEYLDVYKYGSYKEELGGLGSPNTNQIYLVRTDDGFIQCNPFKEVACK